MDICAKNTVNNTVKKRGILSDYKQNWDIMLLMLPGLLLLILFNYVPLYGILIAFKDYVMFDGILGSKWVGMENFSKLFAGKDFLRCFRNTLHISIIKLICSFPAPIILALMLNEVKKLRFKKVVQTFSYIPYFFSWVVLSGIITMLFSVSGPINMVYTAMTGKEPLVFFADGHLFIGMIVGTAVWQGLGWGSIIYLSALSAIDEVLYEAATIDGATRWQQMIRITLPCLIPTIVTVFILNLSGVLNAGFDQIYNLYNPTVYDVSDILDTYVLRRMQSMDYSIATAAGLFKSVICFVLVVASNFIVKRVSDNELGIW